MNIRSSRLIRSLLAASVMLGATGCGKPAPAADAPPPRVVRVAAVHDGAATPAITASGVAASRDEARLAFKVGGVIKTIDVREGDTVKRGQRLATIATAEIDAQVTQARASALKAQRDLERGQQLYTQDVVTREQLDDLGTADALARAQLAAAAFNRRYAEILAPDDGRVLRRLVEAHELVAAGTPVLVVSSRRSGVVLRVGLVDRDALRVHAGDPARIEFDALPGRQFVAQVVEVSPAADPRSGTYRAELELATDADGAVFSGLIGRARIMPASGTQGSRSRLPIEALVEGDQRRVRVYRYDPVSNQVHSSELAVSFIDGGEAVLTESLPPGTMVVTEGAAYLHDGETVRVVEATP